MSEGMAMKGKRYLTSRHVRERYGDRSHMWLWRILKADPRFPRPLKIRNNRYFDEEALDAYDRAQSND